MSFKIKTTLLLVLMVYFNYTKGITININNSPRIKGVHFRIISYENSLEHLLIDTIVNNSTLEFNLENTFLRIELPEFNQSFPIILNEKQNNYGLTFSVSDHGKLEFNAYKDKHNVLFDEHLLLLKQFNLLNDLERVFDPKYLKKFENCGLFYKAINDSFELHQFPKILSANEFDYLNTKKQILKLIRIPNHEKKFFLLYNNICQKLNDSKFLRETDLLYELFKIRLAIQKKQTEISQTKNTNPFFIVCLPLL